MKDLIIEATTFTPKIYFSLEKNIFEIEGESVPGNTAEFYMPIVQWLKDYEQHLYYTKNEFGNAKRFSLNLKFEYFNSTSAKWILDLFFVIQKYNKEGFDAQINWYYHNEDIDMRESGKEFAGLCLGLAYNMVAI
jgi:hypothetical protein